MARIGRPKTNRMPSITQSNVKGFLAFGEGDAYPQELLKVADASVTGGACLDAIADYISGNGFNDEAFADMIINRHGETADDLLDETAWNIAKLKVITIHVSYNGSLKIAGLRAVAAELVRLKEPDDLNNITHAGIFPYLGNDFKKDLRDKHTLLPLFNPDPEVVLSQIEAAGGIHKYFGQLLYLPVGRKRGTYYPVPEWSRAIKPMQTEARLDNFDLRHVASDFAIAGIFMALAKEIEDLEGEDEDEYDDEGRLIKTRPQGPVLQKRDLVSMIEDHQGDENSSSVLVYEAETVEELEQAKFLPTTGVELADRYNSINDRVPHKITRAFWVPNELVGIRREGGIMFSPDELATADRMMQRRVNGIQRKLEQLFRRMFQHWHQPVSTQDFTIENANYFQDATGSMVNAG